MKTRNLSEEEFKGCYVHPMVDVTSIATDVLDIWSYVRSIPASDLAGHAIVDGAVECVYRNEKDCLDHVGVVTTTPNVFLVVVVDLKGDLIWGHHVLDLNEKYGLK